MVVEFKLTPEQDELQQAAIEFARATLATRGTEADRKEDFIRESRRASANIGVFGVPVPVQFGGLDLGLPPLLAVMEGLGYGGCDQGVLFSINAHLWTNSLPILTYGTDEQRTRYLPGLSSGELIGANAASEPNPGFDVYSMATTAVRRDGVYVLNGTKTFVTTRPWPSVRRFATVDRKLGASGVTAFIVERNTPGLSGRRKLEKMGQRTSPMAEVVLPSPGRSLNPCRGARRLH